MIKYIKIEWKSNIHQRKTGKVEVNVFLKNDAQTFT